MPGMTAFYDANGDRITKAAFPVSAKPDPQVKILTEDVYKRRPYGDTDQDPDGSLYVLAYRTGDELTQAELDAHYPAATATAIDPASGPEVGGTVVTITGTNLSGVSSVTFDAVAGTALEIVSQTALRVTTPAGSAGTADVVLNDDSGAVNKAAFYTYS